LTGLRNDQFRRPGANLHSLEHGVGDRRAFTGSNAITRSSDPCSVGTPNFDVDALAAWLTSAAIERPSDLPNILCGILNEGSWLVGFDHSLRSKSAEGSGKACRDELDADRRRRLTEKALGQTRRSVNNSTAERSAKEALAVEMLSAIRTYQREAMPQHGGQLP
jgi:hypothetical protein